MTYGREKPERGHAVVLRGTLFLGRTAALTGSIFELAKLHQLRGQILNIGTQLLLSIGV